MSLVQNTLLGNDNKNKLVTLFLQCVHNLQAALCELRSNVCMCDGKFDSRFNTYVYIYKKKLLTKLSTTFDMFVYLFAK